MTHRPQWVNLPKKPELARDGIPSEEHLGAVRFEYKFKKDTKAKAQFRVIRETELLYNEQTGERNRNQSFKSRWHRGLLVNDGKTEGVYERQVTLSAAGGVRYRIEAKQGDKVVVGKKKLETRRRLYYQSIALCSPPSSLDTIFGKVEATYDNDGTMYRIELVEGDRVAESPSFDEALTLDNKSQFLR